MKHLCICDYIVILAKDVYTKYGRVLMCNYIFSVPPFYIFT